MPGGRLPLLQQALRELCAARYSLVMPSVMMSVILQQEDSMRMLSWSTTSTWGQRTPAGDGAAGRSPALHPDGALGLPARSDPFPASSSSSSSSSPAAHLPFSLLLHLADHIVHDLCKRQGAGGGVSTPNLPAAPQGAHLQHGGCAGGAGTPPLLMGPCQTHCTPPRGPKTAILGWPRAATRSVGLFLGWRGCFGDLAQGVAPKNPHGAERRS